jgi:16S rRNA (cytosine967-C5)-methyltransferase
MKVDHQIRTFERILAAFDGSLPLHRFLLQFFRSNKQMGSSDRRWASRYLFSFFRFGNCLPKRTILERLAIADFLCNDNLSLISQHILGDLSSEISLSLEEKINWVQSHFSGFNIEDVFPFKVSLSSGLNQTLFYQSFWQQPNLFIRVRANDLKAIKTTIEQANIQVSVITDTCLALPNGTQLDKILTNQYYFEVQDYSSQQTATFFKPAANEYWWDCCAASGGKSLLLHSIEPNIQLLVSDIRESSLQNLQERFRRAGLRKYQTKVLNLTENNDQILAHYGFDGILLDAPCSGSGTWGRSPEMLRYFNKTKIEHYQSLQQNIALNVIRYLKVGQPLIYMTCSVFAQENEQVVAFLEKNAAVKLERMQLIQGFENKADNMFVARLIKQ